MTRLKVFHIRLAASAGILLLVFALVRLLWYPGSYFTISGVGKQLLILAAVNLVIGPGLSAFVYKPGKKGLVTDLGVLAGVELLAVLMATSIIYARQPYFTVFAVDRFEAVSRLEVDTSKISFAELGTRPGHEPRLVYAQLPKDQKVFEQLLDETVLQGKKDIDRRPEFWRPYNDGIPVLKAAAIPLASLSHDDKQRLASVERWLSKQSGDASNYIYLPLRGKRGDAMMILHADIGYPVDTLDVDPW